MALAAAAQEAIALKTLAGDFGIQSSAPLVICEDNQGAVAMSVNPTFYAKTKHVHIKHHFIRETVANGDVKVVYVPTHEMLADCLTKALATSKFLVCRRQIMVS
jgi:hypothetical protein